MKFLFIIIVFCICLAVGYFTYSKYNKRKKFYASLIMLAEKLSVEINFSRERLKILVENFDAGTKKNLLGIDEAFISYLDKKNELTVNDIFQKANCLKQDEKEFILLFLKTLGRSDVENQTKEISSFIQRFNEKKEETEKEHKKYGSLSIKLSVIAGLFFTILLI